MRAVVYTMPALTGIFCSLTLIWQYIGEGANIRPFFPPLPHRAKMQNSWSLEDSKKSATERILSRIKWFISNFFLCTISSPALSLSIYSALSDYAGTCVCTSSDTKWEIFRRGSFYIKKKWRRVPYTSLRMSAKICSASFNLRVLWDVTGDPGGKPKVCYKARKAA